MSRKTDLNLSIGVDVKKGFEEAVVDIKNNGNVLAKASKQIAQTIGKDYKKSYDSFNASFKDTSAEIRTQKGILRELNQELKRVKKTSADYNSQDPHAQKRKINEATAAIRAQERALKKLTGKAMAYKEGMKASQMKIGIQDVGNAVEGVARSFQVAQGAAAIFGDENEDVMKAMHKMQAVMVFSEGLRGLKHLKTSFQVLNAVIRQNPLIAFGIALAGVAFAIRKFRIANDDAYQAQNDLNKAIETGNVNAAKEISHLEVLYNRATSDTNSREDRIAAVNEMQDLYPKVLSNLDDEAIMAGEAADQYNTLRTAILNKARASAVSEALEKRAADRLPKELKLLKQIELQQKTVATTKKTAKGASAFGISKEEEIEIQENHLSRFKKNLKTFREEAEKSDKILLDMRESFEKKYNKILTPEGSDKGKGKGKGKTDRPSLFEQDNAQLENDLIDAQNVVKQSYRDGLTSKHKYEQEISSIEVMFANRRLEIAKEHHKQTNKLLGVSLDKQKEHLDTFATKVEGLPPITLKVDVETPDLKENLILPLNNASQEAKKNVTEVGKQVQGLLETSTEDMVANMAVNIANAADANKTIGEAMGDTILVGLSDFLVNMGRMMIAAGVTKDLFDKAMTQLGGGLVAAGAGFSLLLAGSAMKSAMQKNLSPVPLAEGGVMKGTTFGLLAEYPTANNDPEVAIRSSYLRGMIGDAVGGNGGNYIAETKISGRDLYILMKRGQTDYSRG